MVHGPAADDTTVKAVGAGHSFTSMACTDGYQLDLLALRGGDHLAVDTERRQVTVEAGITLAR